MIKKTLQILDIRSVSVDNNLFNVTAINADGDPYWVEFIKPHFDEINIGIEILPIDKINKDKKWIINVDINAWNWYEHDGDIFQSLGPTLIDGLNSGNAYLILNHQCESFTKSFLQILYKRLKEHPTIPYTKIVYMVGAADANREYENFVGDYRIATHEQIVIIYAHHIYKRFKHDNSLSFFNFDRSVKKEKKFLSLNRRWHDHRLLMICSLAQQNLLQHGYVSLGVMPDEIPSAESQIKNIFRKRIDFYNIQEGFYKIKDRLPLQIDSVDLRINHFQTTSLPIEFYQKSYFSLVSSTSGFSHQEQSVGFTEKEVRPIIAKHPFIIHNLPGVLRHLRAMGFLTFESWFDESYDKETNDWERMNKIVKEVKRLSELSTDTWDSMLEEMEPVLAHNYNRMVNYTSEHCYFNSDLKNLVYYVS